MARSREPFLLLLRAGPTWDVGEGLAFFVKPLAAHYEGEVVTHSSRRQRIDVGRMRVVAHTLGPKWVPMGIRQILYMLGVLARGLRIRWIRRRRLVVVTYDPLRNGLIGVLLRWLTGATFICEVNGVYGHPDTLIDLADRKEAAVKRGRMRGVASFVLRRADVIKLLYPEQLVGLSVPLDHPPREVFHDAVNSDVFQPRGIEPERRLLFVGHPFLLKGVDLLLEAFARVRDDFPGWQLLIVGWRIEESARAVRTPLERVEFMGPQPPDMIRDLMERSSAIVLPSRSEAMGRVLLEAAFLGRPRIGSRAGGIPWVIDDGVDGLLFNSGDPDDLERILRKFLSAPDEERTAMGQAARSRALRSYSVEEYISKYRRMIDLATTVRNQAHARGGAASA